MNLKKEFQAKSAKKTPRKRFVRFYFVCGTNLKFIRDGKSEPNILNAMDAEVTMSKHSIIF